MNQMERLESAEIEGTVSLEIGRQNLGLIQLTSHSTSDEDPRVNLVVAMIAGRIVSMQDYRRLAKARRAAKIAA